MGLESQHSPSAGCGTFPDQFGGRVLTPVSLWDQEARIWVVFHLCCFKKFLSFLLSPFSCFSFHSGTLPVLLGAGGEVSLSCHCRDHGQLSSSHPKPPQNSTRTSGNRMPGAWFKRTFCSFRFYLRFFLDRVGLLFVKNLKEIWDFWIEFGLHTG